MQAKFSYNLLRILVVKTLGNCWLCGRYRELTEEHTPPRSCFNNHDILLQSVAQLTEKLGRVIWEGKNVHGWKTQSLCAECNNDSGRKYGSHYVDFIKEVAEKVDKVDEGEHVAVTLKRPLSILKQVMMNFVTANGQYFVKTHTWIRKFLRDSRNQDFPKDWYVYVFAIKSTSGRKTGVGGFYDLIQKKINVVAEFTFWPLGTLLAFQPMDDYPVVPIHHFAQYAYTDSNAKVVLNLSVNPSASAYPADFRTKDHIVKDRFQQTNNYEVTQEQGKEMEEKIFKYIAEEDRDGYIASGHPSTFRNLKEKDG